MTIATLLLSTILHFCCRKLTSLATIWVVFYTLSLSHCSIVSTGLLGWITGCSALLPLHFFDHYDLPLFYYSSSSWFSCCSYCDPHYCFCRSASTPFWLDSKNDNRFSAHGQHNNSGSTPITCSKFMHISGVAQQHTTTVFRRLCYR